MNHGRWNFKAMAARGAASAIMRTRERLMVRVLEVIAGRIIQEPFRVAHRGGRAATVPSRMRGI